MATDVMVTGRDEPEDSPTPPAPRGNAAAKGGFFTIYKKGQGYWTRLGTALGVMLLLAVTAFFVYNAATVWLPPAFYHAPVTNDGEALKAANLLSVRAARNLGIGLAAGIVVVGAFIGWRLMNRPGSVDFLIATDTEMKKVNWTSKADLIGSTKVVIFFMLLIAALLFLIDVLFGYFFYFITVLKTKPF